MSYDAVNKMTGVSGMASTSIVYEGDGNHVKSGGGANTTTFIGSHYEWTGSTTSMVKNYYASGVRVAMRTGSGTGTTGLVYLVGDHLGSTSAAANPDGSLLSKQLYKACTLRQAWGEVRYTVRSFSPFPLRTFKRRPARSRE